ncbi:uncharacterized protein LOC123317004 [Coccinella septempunctata]|uniref:uncharacterized protein LOC123317004 n=1 Tax=Coccinella septempunctata TaxID=41139 RepID=UPI001D070D6B|nr:uncharacterized protein LOC123317004 [Coccinella septempunctata]
MSRKFFFLGNRNLKLEKRFQEKGKHNETNILHIGTQKPSKPSFAIIHQNIQSIGNAVDQLEVFLQDHKECEVLCLSEHWKTGEQLMNYSIANYNLLSSFCRGEKIHGGSAIYVGKNMKNFQNREKIVQMSEIGHIECAAIEDHSAQQINIWKNEVDKYNIYRRHFTSQNRKVFREKLESCCWSEIYTIEEENVNRQWMTFYSKFLKLFNETFPKKKSRIRRKTYINRNHPEIKNAAY